jgi:hypothetical protein
MQKQHQTTWHCNDIKSMIRLSVGEIKDIFFLFKKPSCLLSAKGKVQ